MIPNLKKVKFSLFLLILITFLGCPKKVIKEIKVQPINQEYIELIDANNPRNSYLMDDKNYIKPRDDIGTDIANINNSSMILSSILNFNRLSHNDIYGILQPDKIFLNTIDLNYLELPTHNSMIKLAVLDLKGKGTDGKTIISSLKKITNQDGTLKIKFKNKLNEPSDSRPFEDEALGKYYYNYKKGIIKKNTDSTSFHDRAMASIFADNDSQIHGFSKIANINNFEIDYVEHDQSLINKKTEEEKKKARKITYLDTINKVKKFMDENYSIVSTSLGLFTKEEWVREFRDVYNEEYLIKKGAKQSEFNRCISTKKCKDDKFVWNISLANKKDFNETNNPSNLFEIFRHTNFITAVSSIVDTNLSKNNKKYSFMKFKSMGSTFSDFKGNIGYFSINLPEKVLVAYAPKKLKFIEASTSYATAVFSAVLYNLYSLNPNLTEETATNILRDTAYNQECKNQNIINTPYIVNIDNIKQSNYFLKCADNHPDKIGYVVNIKGAYKKAIKVLLENHLESYFMGDINNSLYRNDSIIEKTTLIKDGYIVKRIKIKDKNINNMKKGTASIINDTLRVKFSKNNIVCRYEQSFDSLDGSYSDITKKEIIIKYNDDDGSPYILEERNLMTESY
jgi:hypothetical protein